MKEKQIKLRRRKYDATFKKEVLHMVGSDRPVPDIAKSLGVGENLILPLEEPQQEQGSRHITK